MRAGGTKSFAALLLLALGACRTAPPVEPDALEEVVAERATPWLTIWAENRISRQQKLDVMARVARAFDYGLVVNAWQDPDAICEEKLQVKVRRSKADEPSARARSTALFEVEITTAADYPGLDEDLAHELTHVQDLRALREVPRFTIPRYLHEGKAQLVGRRYVGKQKDAAADLYVSGLIAKLTAAEVKAALKEFRDEDETKREKRQLTRNLAISFFYVEYLRTRVIRDRADILPLLGRIFEQVGQGESYEALFFDAFGLLPVEAEESFVAFVQATENKWPERRRGTIWQDVALP